MPRPPRTPPELPPARVLAWSEWAVEREPLDPPILALWLPEGAHVALGLSQDPEREARTEAEGGLAAGLVRRQSGGGAVLLYRGVLCWEALADFDFIRRADGDDGIRSAYRALCGPVVAGLARLGVGAFPAGVSDLSVGDPGEEGALRKIAGTAQLRRRGRALVHGALLVEADVSEMSKHLRMPSAKPEYRGERSHREFCVSLRELLGRDGEAPGALTAETADAIREAARDAGWRTLAPPAALGPEAAALELNKYLNPAWNRRRERGRATGD